MVRFSSLLMFPRALRCVACSISSVSLSFSFLFFLFYVSPLVLRIRTLPPLRNRGKEKVANPFA